MKSNRGIAVIPARGGSKGIPRKNLSKIGEVTLVELAIRSAADADIFDLIFVSTDDLEIADLSRSAGADVSFLRSSSSSNDSARSLVVVQEVLDNWQRRGQDFDFTVLLEPTSPARTPRIIREAVRCCHQNGFDGCVTLSPVEKHLHAAKQIVISDDGFAVEVVSGQPVRSSIRRQDLNPSFIKNGMVYASLTSSILNGSDVCGFRPYPLIVDAPLVNIDTLEDLELARRYLQK